MRPLKSLISMGEAVSLINENTFPLERTEEVNLTEAAGRVTSENVHSRMDIPPFDRAAMDGYAVKAEDCFGASKHEPVKLELLGKIYAGEVSDAGVVRGGCLQIATGAVMPYGADAVVMVEYTELESGRVSVSKPVYPGENVSCAGSDIGKHTLIVGADVLLTPALIGGLAAVGIDRVEVYVRPAVTIISTGDEVVNPAQELKCGQIYDVNSYTLAALLTQNGARVELRGPCRDDPVSIAECLHDPTADMIIFTGGSSVGERDVLVDAIESNGEIVFHGIAVKPGKPTLFARVGKQLVFGMPGYPTSCLSNGYMFLAPALRKMARLPEAERRTVRLPISQRIVSAIGRHQFFTVTIENGVAVPAFKESGAITSMSRADGYIEIPPNVDLIDRGELIDVILF